MPFVTDTIQQVFKRKIKLVEFHTSKMSTYCVQLQPIFSQKENAASLTYLLHLFIVPAVPTLGIRHTCFLFLAMVSSILSRGGREGGPKKCLARPYGSPIFARREWTLRLLVSGVLAQKDLYKGHPWGADVLCRPVSTLQQCIFWLTSRLVMLYVFVLFCIKSVRASIRSRCRTSPSELCFIYCCSHLMSPCIYFFKCRPDFFFNKWWDFGGSNVHMTPPTVSIL